jgi:molybdenum cofactor biosynthesis protein B
MTHGFDNQAFVPVRIAILTVSDSRTLESDSSGAYLAGAVAGAGHVLAARAIVPDDQASIQAAVQAWIDDPEVDAVITTGGTGLTGRDVTPEAVAPLFDKVIEGFAIIFHTISFQSVGLSTIQSRACAGVAGGTFIFCLPGSGGAVRDGWEKLIVHQLDARTRPCNLVEIMPRLGER